MSRFIAVDTFTATETHITYDTVEGAAAQLSEGQSDFVDFADELVSTFGNFATAIITTVDDE